MESIAKNIAVVGCGYWGQNLVRSVHDIGALHAVSDNDPARMKNFAEKYNVKPLAYKDVLNDNAVAGVVLAVPAPLHASMTLEALKAGKHVFVEKPIAMSLDDAAAMVEAANKADRVLMVGHLLHYHPAFTALKNMVADGTLGKLRYIYSNRLNFGKVRTEENVFWSFAPHDVSMILSLADREPKSIKANYIASFPESKLPSTAQVQFDFGDGLSGHINVSWLNPFKEQKLVAVGSKGMAVFDDTLSWDKKLSLYQNSVTFENGQPVLNKAEPEFIALPQAEPLKEECLHFANCIASGATPRTDGHEAARVLKVMQACDKAADYA